MATFRAVHPFVREQAFALGFEPIVGNDYRVKHPRLTGKRAQVTFWKAFTEASKMTGVRRVATPGSENGTTLLFPKVSLDRWEAARCGVAWNGLLTNKTVKSVSTSSETVEGNSIQDRYPRNTHFNGVIDDSGKLTSFQTTTTDDTTARMLLKALRLGN